MTSDEGPAVLGLFHLDPDVDARESMAEVMAEVSTVDDVRKGSMNHVDALHDDAVPVAIRQKHLPDRALVDVLGTDRTRGDRLRAVMAELTALRNEIAGEEGGPDWDGQWGYLQEAAARVETVLIFEEGPEVLEADQEDESDG